MRGWRASEGVAPVDTVQNETVAVSFDKSGVFHECVVVVEDGCHGKMQR